MVVVPTRWGNYYQYSVRRGFYVCVEYVPYITQLGKLLNLSLTSLFIDARFPQLTCYERKAAGVGGPVKANCAQLASNS